MGALLFGASFLWHNRLPYYGFGCFVFWGDGRKSVTCFVNGTYLFAFSGVKLAFAVFVGVLFL